MTKRRGKRPEKEAKDRRMRSRRRRRRDDEISDAEIRLSSRFLVPSSIRLCRSRTARSFKKFIPVVRSSRRHSLLSPSLSDAISYLMISRCPTTRREKQTRRERGKSSARHSFSSFKFDCGSSSRGSRMRFSVFGFPVELVKLIPVS